MKKSHYIDLMEKALAAYSTEHIIRYFDEVKTDGLKEHGFPRLAANIGILMAHGRRRDLKELFIGMMSLCCQQIPKVKAANDFSVKEIIFCLQELDKSDVVDAEQLLEWKNLLSTIEPYSCYNKYADSPETIVYNWAAFTMLSEFMRRQYGLAGTNDDFIDLQAFSQLRHLDENGMYRDPNEPMVYDLVTRGLFALAIDHGYQGKYYTQWLDALDRSASFTLNMQSVTGEIPYGGRSNQFIHNEAHYALMMEYYAKRFFAAGDALTAGKCKAAVERALENVESWLNKKPVSHIKNRFPFESQYGCEKYAYFDKYMITAASFLYVAYRICDETIPAGELDDFSGMSCQTGDYFHKLFLKAGGYFAEYDYRADYHYDCSGLGRLHKKGAPSELCLSVPCPVEPNYKLDLPENSLLAIAPGIASGDRWIYATAPEVCHRITKHWANEQRAGAEIECVFPDGRVVRGDYLLDETGLQIRLLGTGKLRCLLPVFRFNGEEYTQLLRKDDQVEVQLHNWLCRFTVSQGEISDLKQVAANRNGYYDSFAAGGSDELMIHITMEEVNG